MHPGYPSSFEHLTPSKAGSVWILWSLDATAGESLDLSQLPDNQGHWYFLSPRYVQDRTPEHPISQALG